MPFANRKKNILEDLFSSALSQFRQYHPSGNLKFNNLGIFKAYKIAYFNGKNLPISLRLNFTPNTLGGNGLNESDESGCGLSLAWCSVTVDGALVRAHLF